MNKSSGITQLLAETGWYGLGGVLARFMGVISTAVLARLLTVMHFGELDFLLTISSLAIVIISLRTDQSLMRLYHSATDDNLGRLLFSHLSAVTVAGLVLSPLTFWLLPTTFIDLTPKQVSISILRWAAPLVLSGLWFSHILTLLRASRRAFSAVLFSSFVVFFHVILSIPLAIKWGVAGVLAARVISETVCSLFVLARNRKLYVIAFSTGWLMRMLKFGLPLLPYAAIPGVIETWTRYILIESWGASAVGLLSIASRVSLVVGVFVGALKISWLPYAYSQDISESLKHDQRLIYDSFLKTMTFLCLGVMIFSPEIILIVAGRSYLAAAPLTGFLCLAALMQGITHLFNTRFLYLERSIPVMASSFLGGVVSFLFLIFVVPTAGLIAAAAVPVISSTLNNIILYYWPRRGCEKLRLPVGGVIGLTIALSALTLFAMPWLCKSSILIRIGTGSALVIIGVLVLRNEISGCWRFLSNKLLKYDNQ